MTDYIYMNNTTEHNMENISTITVTWKNKSIAKRNITHMKGLLKGRLHTLVKNTVGKVVENKETKTGAVAFNPTGAESAKMILELLRITGGKVEMA